MKEKVLWYLEIEESEKCLIWNFDLSILLSNDGNAVILNQELKFDDLQEKFYLNMLENQLTKIVLFFCV